MTGVFSPFFERSDFTCKCGCGKDQVDAELLYVLVDLRNALGPVAITSANRCTAHNARVGGGKRSQHLYSKAADIKVTGVKPSEVHTYLTTRYPDKYGIGLYNSFIHIDVRASKARWSK